MKKNIIGILHHMINKKDLAQRHLYCPQGSESWCAFQQDVADGTKTYKNINFLPNVFFDLKRLRVAREEALRDKEGTTYEAGAF